MKKSSRKLKLDTDTIRTLCARDLAPIVGGQVCKGPSYPTYTELAGACTVTTYSG